MAESDGEIEYLEEDAEIVQHCVQLTQQDIKPLIPKPTTPKPACLLVERPRRQKRKKKPETESDSDYDPSDENLPPSPPSPPQRKRVLKTARRPKIEFIPTTSTPLIKKADAAKEQLATRKKQHIRIPDYDDPLCLPVRAIKSESGDKKRLDNWNSVCLEHFKHCDTLLKPERGDSIKSVRTAVFRNVVNKQTGNSETTIWSKTCVENKDGDKKSEIFQCVLPRYKEKKMLGNYILGLPRHKPVIRIINEVVLSKETHKDGEALVAYKPKDSLSAVYGLIDNRKKQEEEAETACGDEECKMYLAERAACKICMSCFQGSWRGIQNNKNKPLVCPICARTYSTVYNLLSHFKTHSQTDVARYKRIISVILSDMVGYHYKCRVCRKKMDSIKTLRAHLREHQSRETFTCEVCNRVVNP